jgi:hypothetical protein
MSSLPAGKIQESPYPEDGGDMFLRNISFTTATRQHIPEDSGLQSCIKTSHCKQLYSSCPAADNNLLTEDKVKHVSTSKLADINKKMARNQKLQYWREISKRVNRDVPRNQITSFYISYIKDHK